MALITEERSPEFWRPICEPGLDLGFLESPFVTPYRSEHGGYFLARLDALGRVWDLHAAFLPEGWGKEAANTLKAVLRQLAGWQIITVSEDAANPDSRPPLSYGFRPAGQFQDGYRSWVLTRTAWEQSPASRRSE